VLYHSSDPKQAIELENYSSEPVRLNQLKLEIVK